jgi:hypothetical protein
MRYAWYAAVALLVAAVPVSGSVVDRSAAQSVVVQSGDTISFELFTNSYTSAAQQFGLPLYPACLNFALVTAMSTNFGEFAATLRSSDASISLALPDLLNSRNGYLGGSGFQGTVSTLQASFQFDSATTPDLFSTGSVWLDMTNMGDDVAIAVPSLFLRQDLFASLSGGPLSTGATVGTVLVEHPEFKASASFFALVAGGNATPLPEPVPVWTLAGGIAVLGAFSRLVERRSRAHR